MTRYELAGDKFFTIAAIVFEVLIIISCILLVDASLEYIHTNAGTFPQLSRALRGIQSPLADHVSLTTAAGAFLVLQYLILTLELIVRYRDDQRGWTLPIALLPGGIFVRAIIMIVLEAIVVTIKLITYFLSVMFAFVAQLLRIEKKLPGFSIMDVMDRCIEPIEIAVNKIYNRLYFHKIRPNTSVFTAIFNGSLSFWCINH